MFKESIFADVMASCDGATGLCCVKNDGVRDFSGSLWLNVTDFATGEVSSSARVDLSMPAGAGTAQWHQHDELKAVDGKRAVLEAVVTAVDGTVASHNVIPLTTPGEMILPMANLTVTAVRGSSDEGGQSASASSPSFIAEIRGNTVAMYTTLTTLAHGRFARNAFLFRPPVQHVEFIAAPYSGLTHADADAAFAVFEQSLRVEDVSRYNDGSV